ncbi:hypothetical protein [Gimesia maris]|nr:hypothetical protein [Gimesia maris]QGQ31012.1 hypothetical protein F1729_21565 [Gimesia maris]
MTANKWPVFQCTVNWARARPKTTLIAGGVAGSSSFYAAGVRKCVATNVEYSVLQSNGDVSDDPLLPARSVMPGGSFWSPF